MRATVAFALAAALGAPACGGNSSSPVSSTPAPAATPSPPPPKVVIMSVDGLRPDALQKIEGANISSLIARGSSTLQAQTIMPSNTLPAHVSMLSGYTPAVHQVIWDDYVPRNKISVPTLFTVTRAAGLRTTMVVGKDKFTHFQDTGFVDVYVLTLRGDDDVANQAVVQVIAGFDLMFLHFPDVDLAGHAFNWLSDSYLARVSTVDRAIGRVLAALPASATVILTADHGGRVNGHGTNAALDMTIPWIIMGPGIRPAYTLSTRVTTLDTAATAARVLKLSLPADAPGRPVTEAFTTPGS